MCWYSDRAGGLRDLGAVQAQQQFGGIQECWGSFSLGWHPTGQAWMQSTPNLGGLPAWGVQERNRSDLFPWKVETSFCACCLNFPIHHSRSITAVLTVMGALSGPAVTSCRLQFHSLPRSCELAPFGLGSAW